MIRRAKNTDISTVEEILFDAVMWMKSNGISNLWSLESVKWAALSREYKIDDFYIYFDKNKPVACMAITNKDSKYWPNVEENSSLYLHKLAVKKEARGNGISKEMIDFIKEKAYADYEDKKAWAKKMLVNISKAGFFSSDRTIEQYNKEIWHLEE